MSRIRSTFAAVSIVLLTGCGSGGSSTAPLAAPPATSSPATTSRAVSNPPAGAAPTPLAISPGEQWIVYQSPYDPDGDGTAGNGTYLVRPDGRDQHLLLPTNAGHPDWSPDGQRIAVEAEPDPAITEIWVVNADGTGVQKVVACADASCGGVASPAWSPDGTQLASQRYLVGAAPGYEDDRVTIEVFDLATRTSRIVAKTPAAGTGYTEYVTPRWSPDGKEIVFMINTFATPPADDNLQSSSIAVVKTDGSDVNAPPRVLTDPSLWSAGPDWSPDGRRIVFNSLPINYFQDTTKASNLYTVQPDGKGLSQITHFGENDTRATRPTWTPDGRRIIFTNIARDAGNPWGDRKIGLIDADGSNLTVVPTDGWAWLGRLRPTP